MGEEGLIKADITINKNMVPFDTQSPMVTSGNRSSLQFKGLLRLTSPVPPPSQVNVTPRATFAPDTIAPAKRREEMH